jgi:hypothetical protein
MNVFVIRSGEDREGITKKLEEITKAIHGFNPLVLNKKGAKKKKTQKEKSSKQSDQGKKKKKSIFEFWKIGAKRKMKKSNFVIFFARKSLYSNDNICWEIEKAMKYSKRIVVVDLDGTAPKDWNEQLNPPFVVTDRYTGDKRNYRDVKCLKTDELQAYIQGLDKGNYDVFNQDLESMDKGILLEQYKIFLQTSEDLVTRRQNVNNFYISINSALIAAFGLIWALNILPVYKFLSGVLLAAVGIILSVSWMKLLASYGDLNSSKMKIISHIEKQLPASLYDAEWKALSDILNKRKYVSFTNSEKKVPALFIVVYICVSICGIAFLF